MLPIIRVPEILAKGMESFRKQNLRSHSHPLQCRQ